MAFLQGFVEEFSSIGLEKMDYGNREIRSYPARAILEAASTAFVHRDYRIEDAPLELDIYDDRLVLSIPGLFLRKGRLLLERRPSVPSLQGEGTPSSRTSFPFAGLWTKAAPAS